MLDLRTIGRCMAYVGRKRAVTDSLAPEAAAKLAVLLDHQPGQHLPLCWHWAYFNQAVSPANVGHDGHERLGLFLPDPPLPCRMWAAGEIEVVSPLAIGVAATRITTIEDVSFKDGRSGALCFVTLLHEMSQANGPLHELTGLRGLIRERQVIVYRKRGQAEDAIRQPEDRIPEGFQTVPDATLMAYSSVTQNGHRIHWDRDYCRKVENYPDLVVHGPLLATMLAEQLSTKPKPCMFKFRALAPVFATTPIMLDVPDRDSSASSQSASILRSDREVAMSASLSPTT